MERPSRRSNNLPFALLMVVPLLLACCTRAAAPTHVPASPTPMKASEEPSPQITLAFGGDVMLGRLVNDAILFNGASYPWGDVLPLLQEADLSLVNLECVITESKEKFQPPRAFYFRAHPRVINSLTVAGIDYVTLANNHAMDFRDAGLLETIALLDEHGIAHAGAGANLEDASRPALLEAKGIKVGIVAFADHFVEYGASEDTPGTNIIRISLEEENFRRVRETIQAARAAGADLVVFSIHWGPNMRHIPSPEFVRFAHAVMDAGADIFHGHSAHVFQGVEIYHGKPILYDTGDLVDDYYVSPLHRNDQQFLFLLTATAKEVKRIELVPLVISHMKVKQAQGELADEICQRMVELSASMGTEFQFQDGRLVLEIP